MILAWISLGLFVGFLTHGLFGDPDDNVLTAAALGMVGAVTGGWLFNTSGPAAFNEFDPVSLLIAAIGAAVALVAYHGLFQGSGGHAAE